MLKKVLLSVCVMGFLFAGCAGTRKCNGQRGTRVPMGVM